MKNYKKDASVFKAFCDENRLQILDMLKEGEICACKILEKLNIVQSTLSHHMKILLDAKIVNGRKDGKWTHYSINKQGFEDAKKILNSYGENLNKSKLITGKAPLLSLFMKYVPPLGKTTAQPLSEMYSFPF